MVAAAALLLIWLAAGCSSSEIAPTDPDAVVDAGRILFTTEGCTRCHGETGEGIVGPRLNGGAVLSTFPGCDEQQRWVSLGSSGWEREVGPTYGATAKPVLGGMPRFGSRLTPEQISQVVTYTRTVFGEADAAEVVADCR